jgi:hypothetical protein
VHREGARRSDGEKCDGSESKRLGSVVATAGKICSLPRISLVRVGPNPEERERSGMSQSAGIKVIMAFKFTKN